MRAPTPSLSLEGVRKSYWRGRREIVVLSDVSLDVHAGEVTAIWGQRRSGKSTLLRVAAGLQAPDQGAVVFEGQNLPAPQPRRIRRRQRGPHRGIAWVEGMDPQGSARGSVLDHVALSSRSRHSRSVSRMRAMMTFEQLQILDLVDARWGELKDGERAIVALARALMHAPNLLVADDLAVNLDMLTREKTMVLLGELARERGLAVLMSSSDMSALPHCDQIAALSEGVVVTPSSSPVVAFPAAKQRSA